MYRSLKNAGEITAPKDIVQSLKAFASHFVPGRQVSFQTTGTGPIIRNRLLHIGFNLSVILDLSPGVFLLSVSSRC